MIINNPYSELTTSLGSTCLLFCLHKHICVISSGLFCLSHVKAPKCELLLSRLCLEESFLPILCPQCFCASNQFPSWLQHGWLCYFVMTASFMWYKCRDTRVQDLWLYLDLSSDDCQVCTRLHLWLLHWLIHLILNFKDKRLNWFMLR